MGQFLKVYQFFQTQFESSPEHAYSSLSAMSPNAYLGGMGIYDPFNNQVSGGEYGCFMMIKVIYGRQINLQWIINSNI